MNLVVFKKIYIKNIYNLFKERLMKIAETYNLDYDELETLYLKDMKEFINT